MKQVLQHLGTGKTTVADVPCPCAAPGTLAIRTTASLISSGTERMLVEFGRGSLLDKVRQQPDKVAQVLDKMRTDGVVATLEAVRSKLDQPLALGYCNVGRVAEIGRGVEGFAVGDRVVSNGKHAEVVVVPRNLCARVPEDVDDESASFTVLGAIALQGVRLAQPTLGESVAVIGLGLVGLLAVQILRANGCRVLGVDLDASRLALAREVGAEAVDLSKGQDPVAAAMAFSRGQGIDAALITASTSSSEPVAQAAKMCRKRGRIVLVGVTGVELSRADFYEKELSFQVSCSYGPGRYDPGYEEGGHDYPIGFVRWTEQRNFEAVLDLMASGRLQVARLLTHRYALDRAGEAYDLLASGAPSLGILLEYPAVPMSAGAAMQERSVALRAAAAPGGHASVVFIGAGNYAGRVLIPAFKAAGAELRTVVSAGGASAVHFGNKFGFANASSDAAAALADPAVDTAVIATRHDAHAGFVLAAMRAGKHVFCEKPLCLTQDELAEIEAEAARHADRLLMVGFNRRFAPLVVKMRELLRAVAEPKSFIVTVNAGAIAPSHWTQDPAVGGGRIVGEACHFIDLLRHLAGAPIVGSHAVALGRHPALAVRDDKATLTLEFGDGSVGTIHYLANGDRGFPKERVEVFSSGRVLQLDNFRRLAGWGWKGFRSSAQWRQDKGQAACAKAFVDAVRGGGAAPIPLGEILEVSRASIELQQRLRG
ncbi:MAG: bi-domain-containing oxidoreductase [Burkholderiales bacterium]|nr:bi-domain-containing oxidoreductase [Burkholderiales bacterium]